MKTQVYDVMKKINEDIVNISVNFKLTELFSPDLNGIYRIQNTLRLDCRPVEMEKILGVWKFFKKCWTNWLVD